MLTMLGAFAEFERELIRERVKAGLRGDRAGYSSKGKRLGRPLATTGMSRTTLWRRNRQG